MSRLVLVGAGHAHMTLMAHIEDIVALGHDVVVIGPGDRHYYSGMGPGMLGGDYKPQDISFPVKRMCTSKGADFVVEKCVGVDPDQKLVKLASGREVAYDVVSFNTGSYIVDDVVEEGSKDVFTCKPIENLFRGREQILERAAHEHLSIGVVGGGPAGLEVACNAWACAKEKGNRASVRLYIGRTFMKSAPEKVRKLARKAVEDHHIEMIEGSYVEKVSTGKVTLQDGRVFNDDIIFIAMGVKPRPLFGPSGIPAGPDGGLLVNEFLQSPTYPDIFGGGDCIYFEPRPLDKVGVYAVRENSVLLANVVARLQGEPLQAFDPGGDYLLIFNTGARTGILHKRGITFGGRPAFWIKDLIDKKFIDEFKPEYEK